MEEYRVGLDFRGHEGEAIYTAGRHDDFLEMHLPSDERAREKLLRAIRSLPRSNSHGHYEVKLYPEHPRLVTLLLVRDAASAAEDPCERLGEMLGDLRGVAPLLDFDAPRSLREYRMASAAR